jgi:hypothetical protein
MKSPEWKDLYQVITVSSDEEFQWALNEGVGKGYFLESWRNLYNEEVGYGITSVFRKTK